MKEREIHLEHLLGQAVRDRAGKAVGRIAEINAERRGDEWFVKEYVIGNGGLSHPFSTWHLGIRFLGFFGARKLTSAERTVRWDEIDLDDPSGFPTLLVE
jgi:hypothetical protein